LLRIHHFWVFVSIFFQDLNDWKKRFWDFFFWLGGFFFGHLLVTPNPRWHLLLTQFWSHGPDQRCFGKLCMISSENTQHLAPQLCPYPCSRHESVKNEVFGPNNDSKIGKTPLPHAILDLET
jgi:hypothetical protein